ncbi:MAG: mycothiol system anti-sigma-R factor [Chloroflexi bacterium]|nr:mycothiol system anti-sigma-R factor [Chloroflexota bacterium]
MTMQRTGAAAGMPPMVDCAEAERRLQGFVDRELTPVEVAEVQMHLDSCANCRGRFRFEEHFRRIVRRRDETETAPAGLRERIRRLLGY